MEKELSKTEIFKKKIERIYSDRAFEILDAIKLPRYETFRVNGGSGVAAEVVARLGSAGFKIQKGCLPNSYVNLSSRRNLKVSQTDFFKFGKIYVQGLSSMLDALVLNPLPSDKILDLCASPGSKTSHMASITGASENITAVENNSSRFYAMKKNLSLQGHSGVTTVRADAASLHHRHPELCGYFDKVLVDVPCSNEGNIRLNDGDNLIRWNPKLGAKISMLQKRILASGMSMLKEGGLLVYSTCTYSFEENEGVVDWALSRFPEMNLEPLDFLQGTANFISGLTSYNKKAVSEKIKLSIRVLPSQYFDGFFIALFRKGPYQVR